MIQKAFYGGSRIFILWMYLGVSHMCSAVRPAPKTYYQLQEYVFASTAWSNYTSLPRSGHRGHKSFLTKLVHSRGDTRRDGFYMKTVRANYYWRPVRWHMSTRCKKSTQPKFHFLTKYYRQMQQYIVNRHCKLFHNYGVLPPD